MRIILTSLSGALLATTALMAPQIALAQAAPGASTASPPPAAAPTEGDSDEVVVLGRYIPEPMRATSEVAAFLTAEDLQRTGDDSAATALTRVTGLSLISGRFVYVRGLGERYSSALLNGSPLPSPEPLQRVVPLDLFPSSLLAGVTVQKTYSANYPGEFGGGLIDLRTAAIPREPYFSISLSGGGNSVTTSKTGLTYYGGETDALGFDDGTRKFPLGLRALAPNKRLNTLSAAEVRTVGRSFSNSRVNVLQTLDDVPPNFGVTLSGGREFNFGGFQVGAVAILGHDNEWQSRTGQQDYGRIDNDKLVTLTNQDFSSTQRDVTWNGLLALGLRTPDHEFRWTNLWVRNTTKEARTKDGFTVDLGSNVRSDFTEWYERELMMTQLTGEHHFGDLHIDWRGSYAKTTRDVPYENVVQYGRDGAGRLRHNPSSDFNRTRFSYLTDTAVGAGIDLRYELDGFLEQTELRAGYSYTKNERDSDFRSFRYRSNPADGALIQYERIDYIKSDFNLSNGLVFLEETTPLDGTSAYSGNLSVQGVYGQIEAEVIPLVRASVGVRYEDGSERVDTVNSINDIAFRPSGGRIDESYLLPSATVTWNFAEDMQLRLGASKTIARPQFRELSPQQFLDPETDRTNIGNPSLIDTELTNFDARYEWFFGRSQYITVSGFYKEIKKPIESYIFEPSIYSIAQSYINAPKAELFGAEIEAKKYFEPKWGVGFIDNARWLIQANYTYTTSKVKVGSGDTVAPPDLGGAVRPASDYIIDGTPLQGQSKHIANLQFGFEDDAADSQATLLLNYASKRVTARGNLSSGQPDFIQKPGIRVDFTYRKGFEVRNQAFTVSLEARNLTGEDNEEFQTFGGGRVEVNRYDLGRSISVGLSARF